ncbi:hypothetical protein GW916_09155 [bacterium]|nr:hypothetical protein [bacterium]
MIKAKALSLVFGLALVLLCVGGILAESLSYNAVLAVTPSVYAVGEVAAPEETLPLTITLSLQNNEDSAHYFSGSMLVGGRWMRAVRDPRGDGYIVGDVVRCESQATYQCMIFWSVNLQPGQSAMLMVPVDAAKNAIGEYRAATSTVYIDRERQEDLTASIVAVESFKVFTPLLFSSQ